MSTKRLPGQSLSRRRFFKMAGGATVAAAGMGVLPNPFKKLLSPVGISEAQAQTFPAPDLFYAGTDGWISLPKSPAIFSLAGRGDPSGRPGARPVHHLHLRLPQRHRPRPTPSAPARRTRRSTRRRCSGSTSSTRRNPKDFRVQLTNLGLALRPDLFDAHTIHWHGFRNVIPFFDGEPTGSVAVTTGRNFTYIYRPRDPGTYMFHCHVEDVEHVHMGMTGHVLRAAAAERQQRRVLASASHKRASTPTTTATAPPATTASSRCSAPRCGASRTGPTRTSSCPSGATTAPTSALLNGRVYPDTLAPQRADRRCPRQVRRTCTRCRCRPTRTAT